MTQHPDTFVEACCGLGTLTLHMTQGAKPPVSRIGSKAGYVAPILEALGRSSFSRYILWDADHRLVNAVRWMFHDPEAIAACIERYWLLREAEECWKAAKKSKGVEATTAVSAAAWWLWGAGARGGVGGFKGKHKHRPNVDGFIPSRQSLVKRFRELKPQPGVEVHCTDGRYSCLCPQGSVVYLDPPYVDTTGYEVRLSRVDLLHLVKRMCPHAKRIVISEQEPLRIAGAQHIDITKQRKGQARKSLSRSTSEWLTVVEGAG